jgi:hypothetical protein
MSSTPITELDPGTLPATSAPIPAPVAELLVCLPATSPEALPHSLAAIAAAFPNESVLVATPVPNPSHEPDPLASAEHTTIQLIPYTSDRADLGWVLAAADYAAAASLAAAHNASTVLILGDSASPLDPQLLHNLADCLRTRNVDLVLPTFHTGPNDALVNTALLYPLSRALFGANIHFPLPIHAALSGRMAQRLSAATQRHTAPGQSSPLLWPVAEAAIAGYSVREAPAGDTTHPTPPQGDFNSLFSLVASSLFTDIDVKANFWQRARSLPARPPAEAPLPTPLPMEDPSELSSQLASMIESFHLAQANLQEIWSLVLPPQSRLALKKLSQLAPGAFLMEPDLWARIVYDFALAFHLRTLNRNHLLGAMMPLYLAWVASHLRTVADDPARSTRAIEDTATAFELEKSYIVSRWRWPDRFNP